MDQAVLGATVLKGYFEGDEYETVRGLAEAVFQKAQDPGVFWFTTDDDVAFRSAIGAVYLLVKEEDRPSVERELSILKALGSAMAGGPVDLGVLEDGEVDDFRPIGFVGLWKKMKEK